ncbi:MAG: hypothetical protein Q8R55_04150 [Candidatus Taylorbacteria bacterium]|nr:hypothetical protein [Candidatus Taylorbacteria bacterium]
MKLQITNYKLQVLIILFLVLAAAFEANAQFGFTQFLSGAPGEQLGIDWFFKLLRQATCYFYRLAVVVVVIMFALYGISFLRSRGSVQGVTDARKALTWGLVGGFVIFGAFTIILSVAAFIGVDSALLIKITCQ